MDEASRELARRRAVAMGMGGPERIARQKERGHLNVRERVDALLDAGSFREFGLLNHSDIPGMEDKTAADGRVAGVGAIDGRPVVVNGDDATVLAGSGGRVGGSKTRGMTERAIAWGYPIVNLGEGGGARMPDIMNSDGLSSMTIGRSAGLRMRRVPMASMIAGECFGSPSWHAALADFVVQVKGSCMAVSGPRVLVLATGEQVDLEELGGWRLHAEVTGQTDRVADTEAEALGLIREFLSYLPSHGEELPPVVETDATAGERQGGIGDSLPSETNRTYDMLDIIRTFVDHGRVFEIKPSFDRSVITCLSRLDGRSVGIIANQPKFIAGAMGAEGCDKCSLFIALCDSFHIPLIFLHDTPGFMVGKAAERSRIIGKIINFIEALALSTVPKISLVIRKSYGMAYGNMAGPGMGADFQFAWPSADISFVAPEVAANVVNARKIAESENPEAARAAAIEEMRLGSAPWRAAGLNYLDDVIEAAATRDTLIAALAMARGRDDRCARSERRLANWPTSL